MQSVWVVLLMATLALFFPIGAAYHAFKKNRRGWGIATIVSIFFGMGWLVGVIAIIAPAKLKEGELETLCPECGGARGFTERSIVSQETGDKIRSPILGVVVLIVGIGLSFIAGWMGVYLLRNPLPANANVGSPCAALGLMLSAGGSLAGWGGKVLRQQSAAKAQVSKYECSACGHEWQEKQELLVARTPATELAEPVPEDEGTIQAAPIQPALSDLGAEAPAEIQTAQTGREAVVEPEPEEPAAPPPTRPSLAAAGAQAQLGKTAASLEPKRSNRRWILIAGAAAAVVAVVGLVVVFGLSDGRLIGAPQPTATNTPPLSPTPMGGGGQIAFVSDRDGNAEIYIMNADGSGITRLTNNPARDAEPAWSPDRQHIAFLSDRDGNSEIYVMAADGSGVTRLTKNPGNDARPTWSPDGQHIAFVSDRDENAEIYVMDFDGSTPKNLTKHPAFDYAPAWSPDGQRIAFASWRKENLEIYVMDADGSGVRRLTESQTLDCNPVWSPDGQHILFVSSRAIGEEDKSFVGVYFLEGGRMFATTGSIFDAQPVEEFIYVMDTDGASVTELTGGWAPAWSPDGQHISFVSDRAGTQDLYLMNANGSGVKRLTENQVSNYGPAWGPPSVEATTMSIASAPSSKPKAPTDTPISAPTHTPTLPPTWTATATPSPAPTHTPKPSPTLAPTSTPKPSPTAPPEPASSGGSLILFDAFDSNANDWPTGSHNAGIVSHEWQITGGKYRWKAKAYGDFHWYVYPDMPTVSDFQVTVEGRRVGGTTESNYGVVFRVVNSDNLYHLGLGDDQEFILLRKYRGEWTRLIDWTRDSAIQSDGVNRITVIAEGTHFRLFVNDQFLAEAEDDKLSRSG
ncbi:MAG: hypothetical protein PVH17_06555 [Anaerolineae bacterium]|jgi:TolB protein